MGLSCVGSGAGLKDPCGALSASDVLYEHFFKGREGWQRRKGVGPNYGEPEKQGREEHQPREQRQGPGRGLRSTETFSLCPSARGEFSYA